MVELCRKNHKTGENERVYFCHVPRTSGRTIVKMMETAGWSTSYEMHGRESRHFNYFEIRAHYRGCLPKSFAIIRHPMDRIASAFSVHGNVSSASELFRSFMDMPTEKIYTVWNMCLRPASEFVLDSSEVFRYEDGLAQVAQALAFRGWISSNSSMPHLGKSLQLFVDWSAAPTAVLEKVLQVYAQDFYFFDYQTFPES